MQGLRFAEAGNKGFVRAMTRRYWSDLGVMAASISPGTLQRAIGADGRRQQGSLLLEKSCPRSRRRWRRAAHIPLNDVNRLAIARINVRDDRQLVRPAIACSMSRCCVIEMRFMSCSSS